jgi:hypothetical protein
VVVIARRRPGRALALLAALAAGVALLLPRPAAPESWGGIVPGETTRRELEARYGRPSRERAVVEEGRTVPEWTYVGERAPAGIERMVVSFGFILPAGFTPDVVRSVALYPRPRVFPVPMLVDGFGKPDALGSEESTGRPAMRYDRRGLFVILDATGRWAEMMLFAPAPRP